MTTAAELLIHMCDCDEGKENNSTFYLLYCRNTLKSRLYERSPYMPTKDARQVGLKSDGTTGQTTGHLAAGGSASRYMARRKATRQATELTTV